MSLNRREFLGTATAGIAAAAAPLDRSRISFIGDEVGATITDAIAFAKQYRLSWMEMRGWMNASGDVEVYDLKPLSLAREHARILAGNGLRVSMFDSTLLKCALPGTTPVLWSEAWETIFRQLGMTPEKLYQSRLDTLRRILEIAHAFGAEKIRSFTYWRVKEPASVRRRIADVLSEFGEVAAQANCRVLVETEPITNMASSRETADLFRLLPERGLALNWDPQNSTEWEQPFPDGYRILPKKRIENVHVKHAGLLEPKTKLDWGGIFKALQADGYAGKFALETHVLPRGPKNFRASHESMREIFRLIGEAAG